MMRTQREKGQSSDMNLRAVEQERELKRQRTSKACGKQSSCCSNRLQSANYFDRRRRKSKQREWGGLFFWSVGHSCYRRWRNRTENCKGVPNAQPSSLTTCLRQAGINPRIRTFFDTDVIIRFYTGLPSMEILIVEFEHVSWHVTRQTQSLNRFQEFIIVPMKLRLNAAL